MIIKVSRQRELNIERIMLWRNNHAIHGIVSFSMRKNKGKLEDVNFAYNFGAGYKDGKHYNTICFWGKHGGHVEVEFHPEDEFERKAIMGYTLELEDSKGELDFIMMPVIDTDSPYCEWIGKKE